MQRQDFFNWVKSLAGEGDADAVKFLKAVDYLTLHTVAGHRLLDRWRAAQAALRNSPDQFTGQDTLDKIEQVLQLADRLPSGRDDWDSEEKLQREFAELHKACAE